MRQRDLSVVRAEQSRASEINNRAIINLVKCGFVVNIFTSELVNEFAITLERQRGTGSSLDLTYPGELHKWINRLND